MRYKKRYRNTIKQAAYENACDCLHFGYGTDVWNKCGLSEPIAQEVWAAAKTDLAKDQ